VWPRGIPLDPKDPASLLLGRAHRTYKPMKSD
jgi:hypothetical protein